jgi:hypothetical protein
MTRRILLRSSMDPLEVPTLAQIHDHRLYWGNLGNVVFATAAHAYYSTPGTEVVSSGTTGADPADADRVNADFDAFVLPLANAFRPSFVETLDSITAFVRRLRIPVVPLSVGAQASLKHETDRLDGMSGSIRAFARAVLEKAPVMSVRGEFTADYLAALGIHDVEVIGCPSMFMHGPGWRARPAPSGKPEDLRLALNSTPRVPRMLALAARLRRRVPDVMHIPQNYDDLLTLLGDRSDKVDKVVDPQTRTAIPLDLPSWLRLLEQRDLTVGTRIHGNIASLLAGTAALVLAHDARTRELCDSLGIACMSLSALPPGVSVNELRALADPGPFNRGYDARFERFKAFLDPQPVPHAFSDDTATGTSAFVAKLMGRPAPEPVEPLQRPPALDTA